MDIYIYIYASVDATFVLTQSHLSKSCRLFQSSCAFLSDCQEPVLTLKDCLWSDGSHRVPVHHAPSADVAGAAKAP